MHYEWIWPHTEGLNCQRIKHHVEIEVVKVVELLVLTFMTFYIYARSGLAEIRFKPLHN